MIAGEILTLAAVFAILVMVVYNAGIFLTKLTDRLLHGKGEKDTHE